MTNLDYKNIMKVDIKKQNIIWYGIDYLVFNNENLYTESKKINNILKSKTKTLSYRIQKQAEKIINDLKKENIEIDIELENIQEKLEKIFIADYKEGEVDIEYIFWKINKAFDYALDWIENNMKEEIKKVFVDEWSNIYLLKQLNSVVKNNIRYVFEVEETSKLFRIFLSYNNIKIVSTEIYKKQNKYTGNLSFYGMFFRLASLWYLNDIKDIITNFILLKDANNLSRIDIYMDYNWKLLLKKREKWRDINHYKSRSENWIEAETIQYNIKDWSKLRNYNTIQDKINKNKIQYYKEYTKDSKRLELEIHFWRTGLYKIRNSKYWKVISSIKNWKLTIWTVLEYLFYSCFWYEIEDTEEFWNRSLVVQYQNLFYYSKIKMIEYKELKKEDNMTMEQAIKTVKWRNKKIIKLWLDKEQIIKMTLEDAEIEIKQEQNLKKESFKISYIEVQKQIQEQKTKKDKEMFFIENYKEEFLNYFKEQIEEIENWNLTCFSIFINDYKKNKIKEIYREIKDTETRRQIIKELENILADLLVIYYKKEEEFKKKIDFLDFLKSENLQINYISQVL